MRILLLAMPDATNNFHRMISIPNLGLNSLAGSLKGRGHDVRVLDLVLVRTHIRKYLQNYLKEFSPHLVGISAMSFQFESALITMNIVRETVPEAKILVGGYHASLLYEEMVSLPGHPFDFILRGEGEAGFKALTEVLAKRENGNKQLKDVPGLSYFDAEEGGFRHNKRGELADLTTLPLPDRDARVLKDFRYLTRKVDAIETSRGCLFVCNFCSISNMYGQTFRPYPVERVIEDLKDLKSSGTESVFIVDDNITQDCERMKTLCSEISRQKLNSMEYFVQATATGIAQNPDLVKLMKEANFRVVFLGIESVLKKNLAFLKKGNIAEKSRKAVNLLKEADIAVMGGFIIGNPDDTAEDVREVFRQAKEMQVDLAMVQCVTPYPKTELRENLLKEGLVTNKDDFSRYTGYEVNVKTRHLSSEELNRLLNWENIKMFFDPRWFINNNLVKRREKGATKVMLNNFEYLRGFITGDQFRSRHRF